MIRAAILGAGIGAEHLDGYRRLPECFNVGVICDLDLDRATAVARDIPVTTQLDDVLSDDSIDLIDICLPPHLHVPTTLSALAAGKHVICEKPIATSLSDVDQLIAAEAASEGRVFPVFQYRFGRAMTQFQALHQAGLVGAPHMASLETHWARDAEYYAVSWRGTWAGERGGAIVTHAIHAHDLLTLFFGPVAAVGAQMTTRINDIETEDCAALSFRMENGALATSSVTLGGSDDTTRIRLIFEHLSATSGSKPYAPMNQEWSFQARDPARQADIDAIVANANSDHAGFAGYLAEVSKAIHQHPNAAVTLQDGRRSIELITAAYASARDGGKPVTLPIPKDHALYNGWSPLP